MCVDHLTPVPRNWAHLHASLGLKAQFSKDETFETLLVDILERVAQEVHSERRTTDQDLGEEHLQASDQASVSIDRLLFTPQNLYVLTSLVPNPSQASLTSSTSPFNGPARS